MVQSITTQPWPGRQIVNIVDKQNELPENVSGLKYLASSSNLYAVVNEPSLIYKLTWNDGNWAIVENDNWSDGKTIIYSNGKGSPDSEDLTIDDDGVVYVCTERDNDHENVSKLMVLSYPTLLTSSATKFSATFQWDLTSSLPSSTDPNLGLEGITWVSDTFLVKQGFIDDSTAKPYDPSDYPPHGDKVFFVAYEYNGKIYAYVLAMDGSERAWQVGSFSSGEDKVMSVEFDSSSGYLWTLCDNNCKDRQAVFSLQNGSFTQIAKYNAPSTGNMSKLNNEGFTLAPDEKCDLNTQLKNVYWSDDKDTDDHVLRQGTIPCGAFIK